MKAIFCMCNFLCSHHVNHPEGNSFQFSFFFFQFVENDSSDGGCVTLYGHCKGVTDVLFSKYNPLIFSVSKDNTMRAWKAIDYCCGAVYR